MSLYGWQDGRGGIVWMLERIARSEHREGGHHGRHEREGSRCGARLRAGLDDEERPDPPAPSSRSGQVAGGPVVENGIVVGW